MEWHKRWYFQEPLNRIHLPTDWCEVPVIRDTIQEDIDVGIGTELGQILKKRRIKKNSVQVLDQLATPM